VIKLELKRVRDALYKSADGVVSKEKEKIQMETSMQERREEIRIHVEMLKAQMKAADTERRSISNELHDRVDRISKLKTRSVYYYNRYYYYCCCCCYINYKLYDCIRRVSKLEKWSTVVICSSQWLHVRQKHSKISSIILAFIFT